MSELISRLKEIIEKYNAGCYNETCNPFDSCTDCVLKQIREVIESQPSADQWIPCSERLPNNTDYVLITTQYGVILTVFRAVGFAAVLVLPAVRIPVLILVLTRVGILAGILLVRIFFVAVHNLYSFPHRTGDGFIRNFLGKLQNQYSRFHEILFIYAR